MSVYKDGTETVCVDTVGIAPTSSRVKQLRVGEPPGNTNFFRDIYQSRFSQGQMDALAIAAREAGLSWEGITDELYKNWT